MDDIQRAFNTVMPINDQLIFLQCTAAYPADAELLNLKVITALKNEFPDNIVGLSDHENGIAMAVAAYVLGARVIEKHFTLNHTWKGTDHVFSLEPIGMRKLVRDLRRARLAMGDGVKRPLDCERKPLLKMSKKIVAAKNLKKGTVLEESLLALKSPGDGLEPYQMDHILGKRLLIDVAEDGNIGFEMLG